MGGIHPGQSVAGVGYTTDCQPLPSVEDQGRLQGEGGGALMWSVAVYYCVGPGVSWVVQGKVSPPPVFWPGLPCLSYNTI